MKKKNSILSIDIKENILGYALIIPALILIFVVGVAPLWKTIVYSFQYKMLTDPGNEKFIGFENYITLLTSPSFYNCLKNTIVFAVLSIIFQLTIGYIGAYLMSKASRGRTLIRAAVLIPWAIPGIIVAQMFAFMFNDQLGVINQLLQTVGIIEKPIVWLAHDNWAMLAVVIADTWKQFPYVSLMLLAGLQVIPEELYESASVDGAGVLRKFFSITLPNIKPILLVVLLFRTMGAIRIFDIIFGMTGGGPADSTSTLLYTAYKYLFSDLNYGLGSALSTVIFLIILAFSILYIKVFKTQD